jgi:hypothetical protein
MYIFSIESVQSLDRLCIDGYAPNRRIGNAQADLMYTFVIGESTVSLLAVLIVVPVHVRTNKQLAIGTQPQLLSLSSLQKL